VPRLLAARLVVLQHFMIPRLLNRGPLFLMLICAHCIPAVGQNDPTLAQEIVPYQSYQSGEFDKVNTANGNLILRIPLISLPQRGRLELGFSLGYNGGQHYE
jgi:hypothetical protein